MNKRYHGITQNSASGYGIAAYVMAGSLLAASGVSLASDRKCNDDIALAYAYSSAMTSPSISALKLKIQQRIELEPEAASIKAHYDIVSRAIDQVKNGKMVKVPRGLSTTDEFFEWLHTV